MFIVNYICKVHQCILNYVNPPSTGTSTNVALISMMLLISRVFPTFLSDFHGNAKGGEIHECRIMHTFLRRTGAEKSPHIHSRIQIVNPQVNRICTRGVCEWFSGRFCT